MGRGLYYQRKRICNVTPFKHGNFKYGTWHLQAKDQYNDAGPVSTPTVFNAQMLQVQCSVFLNPQP